MIIDEFVARFRTRFDADPADTRISEESMASLSHGTGLIKAELIDAISLQLALGFAARDLEFDYCSVFTYQLWDNAVRDCCPPFFYEMFVAFDAGECFHDGKGDPSETHTRPMIEAILKAKRENGAWPDAPAAG